MDGGSIDPAFLRGPNVGLEVTGWLALQVNIPFFFQHDFVDEPPRGGIGYGHPRHLYSSQVALQGFEQRHKIPDRKDMMPHETA